MGRKYNADNNEYPGDYLKKVGENLVDEFGDSLLSSDNNSNLEKIKTYTLSVMMDQIKKDLLDLGVIMDNFVSESLLYKNGKVQEAIDYLSKLNLIYKGVLEKQKGVIIWIG